MAEFVLKYADARGEVKQQVAKAASEQELRERYTKQGFMIYSIKPKGGGIAALTGASVGRRKKLNLEKFLIFNSQFVTLIRAGLPILKGLDLLAERLTDPKLGPVAPACLPNCWLKLLTDGASNTVRTERSASSEVLMAAIRRIADSESPPRSKNESSTPTRSSPSTRA